MLGDDTGDPQAPCYRSSGGRTPYFAGLSYCRSTSRRVAQLADCQGQHRNSGELFAWHEPRSEASRGSRSTRAAAAGARPRAKRIGVPIPRIVGRRNVIERTHRGDGNSPRHVMSDSARGRRRSHSVSEQSIEAVGVVDAEHEAGRLLVEPGTDMKINLLSLRQERPGRNLASAWRAHRWRRPIQ
jgi:hypothetical protein